MKFNFDQRIERRKTKSIKWSSEVLKNMFGEEDLLPLWVADMDFLSPPPVREAMMQEVEHGIFGYSIRSEGYYQSVANWMEKRFDWKIQKDWIIFMPGVVSAVYYVLQGLLEPGDGVIIQEPVYYPFKSAILDTRCRVINNQLIEHDGRYEMDFEDLEEKAGDPRTKLLVLCSPHNPVGRVWSRDELNKVAQICTKNNVVILSDEIHHDLVYKPHRHHVLANLKEEYRENIITATAPSKTFNLAGMMSAHVICENSEMREKLRKVLDKNHIGMQTPLSMAAVEAAYREGEEWLEELLDYLQGNVHLIRETVKRDLPKAKFSPPQATYLAWIDFRDYGIDGKVLEEKMVKEGKIALDGGTWFGEGGDGFLRVNFACPRETVKEALERIAGVLNKEELK